MAHPNILAVSRVMRHITGVLMLCWVRALRAGAIVAIATAAAVEIVDMLLLRHFPPDGMAQLVAAGLAFGLGYAVAVTIIADELLVGILDGVGHLMGEAEAGARAAAIAGEREIGEVGSSLFRVGQLGGVATVLGALIDRGERSRTPAADPNVVTVARVPAGPIERSRRDGAGIGVGAGLGTVLGVSAAERDWGLGQVAAWDRDEPRNWPTDETLADLAADEEAGEASEAPTVAEMPAIGALAASEPEELPPSGQPVHATELPRIAWDGAAPLGGAERHVPLDIPVSAAPSVPLAAGGLAAPETWHQDTAPTDLANWHDPMASMYDEEEEAPGIQPVDAFGAPPPAPRAEQRVDQRADQWAETRPVTPATRLGAQITRPLPNPTRPLARGPQPTSPRGSVWDHISQVLAGRPIEPLPAEEDAPAAADGDAGGAGTADR